MSASMYWLIVDPAAMLALSAVGWGALCLTPDRAGKQAPH